MVNLARQRLPLLLVLLPTCCTAITHGVAARSRCHQSGETPIRMAQTPGVSRHGGEPTGWAAARAHVRCSLLGGLAKSMEPEPEFEVGQRVRVKASVVFMHVPGHKGEGFEASGSVGTVQRVYHERNLSANRGVKVAFDEPKKWLGHFQPNELELDGGS